MFLISIYSGNYRDSQVFQEANDTKMSVIDLLVPLLILFSSQVTDNLGNPLLHVLNDFEAR